MVDNGGEHDDQIPGVRGAFWCEFCFYSSVFLASIVPLRPFRVYVRDKYVVAVASTMYGADSTSGRGSGGSGMGSKARVSSRRTEGVAFIGAGSLGVKTARGSGETGEGFAGAHGVVVERVYKNADADG